jgi:putative MATE family efflux protein
MTAKAPPAGPVPGRDLTSGSIQKAIWALAPAMMLETGILNVSQLLDAYWVGQLGSAALAAVTISMTVRWVLNSMSNGLGIGGMAVVARRTGERDPVAAEHAAAQVILLALMISVSIGALGWLLARPLLTLLGADAEVLPLGMSYLRVAFTGMFTMILVFVINAMLRGAGEARQAMNVLLLATATTVVLQPILIVGVGPFPGFGVAGAALAYALGYGAGLLLQLWLLLGGRSRLRLNLRDLRPDFPLMGRVVRIALPSTIQMSLRASSRLAIMWLVGLYGTYTIAAYGVANRLLMIALIPCFGLGNVAGTLVGQNLGALKPGRAERSAWWVSGYSAAYMIAVAALLVIFAPSLIAIFDPTPEVVAIGTQCARIIAPSLILNSIGVVLSRGFAGAGNTIPPMTINLLTLWILEVPLAYGLAQIAGLGVLGIWLGRAVANMANGLAFAVWFRRGKWKDRDV